MKYRTDIDGLRGLAVIAVLLFHAGLPVSGGFVGVDVFFVISGFLITGILVHSAENKKLNVIDFYKRRIIRLYPALCATLILTMIAGFFIFDPSLLVEMSKSVPWAALSASNIYFFNDGGYFAASSDVKPLLHTWSLGVEQQFYLVWPFLIMIGTFFGRKTLSLILILVSIISVYLSQKYLSINSSASYFLTPMRVFELSIGGMLSLVNRECSSRISKEFLCASGIIIIVASSLLMNSESPFPGVAALIPCLGAALCIYAGSAKTSGYLLRNKVFVFIGTISYSLYLVHWPVIVFYKYYIFINPTQIDKFAMLAISFAISIPMYYLCEHVCQNINKKRTSAKYPLLFTVVSIILVVLCSKYIIRNNGIEWRVSEKYKNMLISSGAFHRQNFGGARYPNNFHFGKNNGIDIVVSGDSYAHQLAYGLDSEMDKNISIDGLVEHGCFFGEGITKIDNGTVKSECSTLYKSILEILNGNNKLLMLAFSWDGYYRHIGNSKGKIIWFNNKDEYYDKLLSSIASIRRDIGQNRKLILVGNPPKNYNYSGKSITSCLTMPDFLPSHCEVAFKFKRSELGTIKINAMLKSFADSNKNTYFIDPADALCDGDVCSEIIDNNVVYSDGFHMSRFGSALFIKHEKDKIESIIN